MKTVLVVDDEPALLDIIRQQLSSLGYDALSASLAETAFRLMKERWIDLVLLDVRMPKQSGFSMYRQFAARHRVPVLFMTGDASSFSFDCEELGPLWKNQFVAGTTDILYKPFSTMLLQEKVEALIGGNSPGSLQDRESNRRARQVLARHWIDLGNISLRTEQGVVGLSGEIRRVRKFGAELDNEGVSRILDELKESPRVRELKLNLSNFAVTLGSAKSPAEIEYAAGSDGAKPAEQAGPNRRGRAFSVFGLLRGR